MLQVSVNYSGNLSCPEDTYQPFMEIHLSGNSSCDECACVLALYGASVNCSGYSMYDDCTLVWKHL